MKQRDILFLSISVFALIAFWIGFSINHSLVSSTVSAPVQENIIPIQPNFDMKAIDAIKKRQRVEPLYEAEATSASSSANIPPVITEIAQTSSVSAEVNR